MRDLHREIQALKASAPTSAPSNGIDGAPGQKGADGSMPSLIEMLMQANDFELAAAAEFLFSRL